MDNKLGTIVVPVALLTVTARASELPRQHSPWIVPSHEPLVIRHLPWRPPPREVVPEAAGEDSEDVE